MVPRWIDLSDLVDLHYEGSILSIVPHRSNTLVVQVGKDWNYKGRCTSDIGYLKLYQTKNITLLLINLISQETIIIYSVHPSKMYIVLTGPLHVEPCPMPTFR